MTFLSYLDANGSYVCFNFWRENFRVPRRGLAEKKMFIANCNAFSSPWAAIYDFQRVCSLEKSYEHPDKRQ